MSLNVRKYIIIAQVALCLLSMNACSEDVNHLKWDVHEEQDFKPVRQGIYRSEFVIHQDECEPSLQEVIAAQEDWPPKKQKVYFDVSEEYPHDVLHPPVIFVNGVEVRAGLQYNMVDRLSAEFSPYFSKWMRPMAGWDSGQVQGGCFMDSSPSELIAWLYVNSNSEIKAKIEQDGTIYVSVENVWNGMPACSGVLHDYNHWIPKSPCKESYSFRYVLEQPCEQVEQCQLTGGWVHGHSRYPDVDYYATPVECECER